MDASPGSNASSSDLYSPSDRAEEDPSQQLHSIDSGSESSEAPKTHIRGGFDENFQESETYTLPEAENETISTSNVQTFADSPTVNGHPNHKRKRDSDDEALQNGQRQISRLGSSHERRSSSRTISLESVNTAVTKREGLHNDAESVVKRPRLEGRTDLLVNGDGHVQSTSLPAEIWQHVFSFVPPVFLGRLIRINRAFSEYLTSAKAVELDTQPRRRPAVQIMDANEVWAASRKRFAPGLPKPLIGLSELAMWRLLRGRQCQVCGEEKVQHFATGTESPLESGPGDKGLRIIWPFGVRSCGVCLHKCSEKVPRDDKEACKFFTIR